MNFLSLELIHAHSRIPHDCEDELLLQYADAAEEAVLGMVSRTYDDVVEEYGKVPAALVQAGLLYVEHLYQNRGMTTPSGFPEASVGPLIKPYIKTY